MQHQNLKQLLQFLATTPNGDKYMQFVLHLAEQSVTAETLQALIHSGKQINTMEDSQGATTETTNSNTIRFTQKEIKNMDKDFKNVLILNGLVAKVRTRPSGKNKFLYEIRFRAHGYSIIACSSSLKEAKAKFLAKTAPGEIEKCKIPPSKLRRKGKNLLHQVFTEWLSLKKGTVGEKEIKRFESNFNNLPEELQYMPIFDIRAIDLDAIMKNVQPRKYEELRTLFNGIFKYAIASGLIQNNPVTLIKFKRAERQNRDCLSEDEIKAFLNRIKDSKYDDIRQGAYLLYYFGLRPCEVDEETHVDGEFLITRNRKRKNGKIEYKKIPIHQDAWKIIDWKKPITFQCGKEKFHNLFKELLNGKTAYCLRHTFATVCQQYVRPDIVDIWMGDSTTRLVGKVYTHFPDKFMLENMRKVEFLSI